MRCGMSGLCGHSVQPLPDEPSQELLILGLEGSGKSLLVRRLQGLHGVTPPGRQPAETMPTMGTEVTTISTGTKATGRKLRLRELGGSMSPIWPDYFSACRAVIFVVDLADAANLAPAAVELYELLQHPDLKMKPLLLVFNKCDAPATVSQSDLELVLSLSDLQRVLKSQLNVMEVSAVTGHGVPAMLDWMVKTGAVTGAVARE
ncbi:ADP-ribosylation factor family-domain-containing protein [Haematococcus lacustris]